MTDSNSPFFKNNKTKQNKMRKQNQTQTQTITKDPLPHGKEGVYRMLELFFEQYPNEKFVLGYLYKVKDEPNEEYEDDEFFKAWFGCKKLPVTNRGALTKMLNTMGKDGYVEGSAKEGYEMTDKPFTKTPKKNTPTKRINPSPRTKTEISEGDDLTLDEQINKTENKMKEIEEKRRQLDIEYRFVRTSLNSFKELKRLKELQNDSVEDKSEDSKDDKDDKDEPNQESEDN